MGKATTIYAINGSEVLLPCTFSSCFGFRDLGFWWTYNGSETFRTVSCVGGQGGPAPTSASTPGSGPFWTDPTAMAPKLTFLPESFAEPVWKDLSGRDA